MRAREELAASVRTLLIKALLAKKLGADDAEDCAQNRLMCVLDALVSNPKLTNPDGYVLRAAEHIFIDFVRHQSSRGYNSPVDTSEPQHSKCLTQEAVESLDEDQQLLKCIEEILARPKSPKTYVCLIEAHYMWDIPIEAITCYELDQRNITSPASAKEQKKAKNAVERRVARACTWLQIEAQLCCDQSRQ